jgi:hypothetical protein
VNRVVREQQELYESFIRDAEGNVGELELGLGEELRSAKVRLRRGRPDSKWTSTSGTPMGASTSLRHVAEAKAFDSPTQSGRCGPGLTPPGTTQLEADNRHRCSRRFTHREKQPV